MLFRLIFVISIFLLGLSCNKREANVIVEFCPEIFEPEDQILIGKAVNLHIKNDTINFPILSETDYPEAYDYVEQLFRSMVNTQPIGANVLTYNWHLNIVHNDTIRTAFFVPGGEFYVYTGLLKYLNAEHQLLSIIAHELYYANSQLIPLTIKNQDIVDCVDLGDLTLDREVPSAADIATALPMLRFSETSVIKADSFAITVLCPFLYDPLGIREVILLDAESTETFHWLEYRFANKEVRIQEASRLAADCDLGGVRNEDMYLKFKTEQLP